ncbi:hypothetical protein BS78_01G363100 [Paspalum vaginatum]|nr:hypothetical protein BS78_01G363100 [Paspalum vaginatum]
MLCVCGCHDNRMGRTARAGQSGIWCNTLQITSVRLQYDEISL